MHTVHFNLQKQNWKDWLVNIGAYIYYSFTTFGCIFMLVNASLCKVLFGKLNAAVSIRLKRVFQST